MDNTKDAISDSGTTKTDKISDYATLEYTPLITKQKEAQDDIGYRKYRKLDIQTKWLHWLIGPIVSLYMFAMLCSYYALIEYTNHYFLNIEYHKANVDQNSNNKTSPFCQVNHSSTVYQIESKATSDAATWNIYFAISSGVPAVISNLILGSYTDVFGRKFLLAIGIIGTCLRLSIAAVIVQFKAHIAYLLIACFVEGCTGQYATILQTSLAYVADITEPGRVRILGIVFVEGVIGVALSAASLLAGYLLERQEYMMTFASMAGVLIVAFFIMIFVLPETLTKEHRSNNALCISMLKKSVSFVVKNDSDNRRWKYQLLLLIHALCNMSFLPRIPTETLYQLASPFCWTPTKVGIYAAVRTVIVMIVALVSIDLLRKCMDEITICVIGTLSYGAAFLWTAFVADDISFYIIMIVGSFGPLSTTMQRSILSHLTPPKHQGYKSLVGAIFSTVGTLEIVTSLLANATTSAIYSATLTTMRGFVFLVLGSYDAVCIILLFGLKVGWYLEKQRTFQSRSRIDK